MEKLTIQRTKHVDVATLNKALGSKMRATKSSYGVILTKTDGTNFTEKDAIIIAEKLKLSYNGKVIK